MDSVVRYFRFTKSQARCASDDTDVELKVLRQPLLNENTPGTQRLD